MRVTRERIEALWYTKKSNAELCAELGITKNQLWMAKQQFRLPMRDTRVHAEPDEAEIARMCQEFQAGWSEEERARRYAGARSVRMLTLTGRLAAP